MALLVELGLGTSSKGAVATGALFVGFPGLDAPARTRAAWQAAVTPFVGLAAAFVVPALGKRANAQVAAPVALGTIDFPTSASPADHLAVPRSSRSRARAGSSWSAAGEA